MLSAWSATQSLVDLEGEITCAVCLECYTEPKVLPCCHYFCKKCILKVALGKDADKPFSCPECLKETYLPEGDVNNLLEENEKKTYGLCS